jgi:hypothetical protein
MDMEYPIIAVKSFVAGVLSAYLLIYGLRPSVMNPDIILELFENQWLFLILLMINYYVYLWDITCGALLLLCIIGLGFDYIVFTDRINQTNNTEVSITPVENYINNAINSVPKMKSVDIVSGTFEDNMLRQLNENSKNTNVVHGAPSPFIL